MRNNQTWWTQEHGERRFHQSESFHWHLSGSSTLLHRSTHNNTSIIIWTHKRHHTIVRHRNLNIWSIGMMWVMFPSHDVSHCSRPSPQDLTQSHPDFCHGWLPYLIFVDADLYIVVFKFHKSSFLPMVRPNCLIPIICTKFDHGYAYALQIHLTTIWTQTNGLKLCAKPRHMQAEFPILNTRQWQHQSRYYLL